MKGILPVCLFLEGLFCRIYPGGLLAQTGPSAQTIVLARGNPPAQATPSFSTYYGQRRTHFETLPLRRDAIVFLGNSITDGAEWSELFGDPHVLNRGISGDVTAGVLFRLHEVLDRHPAKIFLLIGINDLAAGRSPDSILGNIFRIADSVRICSPGTRLYVQSLLPVNDHFSKFPTHVNKGREILYIKGRLEDSARVRNYSFVNLYPSFCNKENRMDTLYTNDGLHLEGSGYRLWKSIVFPLLYDLQPGPSLIPLPQSLQWSEGRFDIDRCGGIVLGDTSLLKEALALRDTLTALGKGEAKIVTPATGSGQPAPDQRPGASPFIKLQLGRVTTPQVAVPFQAAEAYQLIVARDSILLRANTPHGIFNGLQTLYQLMRDGEFVPDCRITDWPAFPWRGYMVDVGRNYQSPALLMQQIDEMARYKMNVFQFHLTEDLAWRLESKRYPQLTNPAFMDRGKGWYYTVDEVRALIRYCRERYITLVPELDMPGHSAAFKRAMGTDMQTDSGMRVVRNLLDEVCDTYDVPIIHIGGDEVRITNKSFLPEMTRYLQSRGKQVVGWSPGGDMGKGAILQLWNAAPVPDAPQAQARYIDSRLTYLNHLDPEESVPSLFERQIGDRGASDGRVLGGTICLWHDRNITDQRDLLRMNPVYPSMLAFAERTWRGGGYVTGFTAYIGDDTSGRARAFAGFEARLIDHKRLYFKALPFPYVRQSSLRWQLIGPFPNHGDLGAVFEPEKTLSAPVSRTLTRAPQPATPISPASQPATPAGRTVTGGTIILKHFWYPDISAVLDHPTDSTTWYAHARYWSETDTTVQMWIGFYDFSRSTQTATPAAGTWNNLRSKIWLNGQLIAPPHWRRAGQAGNLEIPYTDENYAARPPLNVHLEQGWNQVLVKLPVGTFRSPEWYAPVKWMFTAIFVKPEGVNEENIF